MIVLVAGLGTDNLSDMPMPTSESDAEIISSIFYSGEIDFKDRAIAELRRMAAFERAQIKLCESLEAARRRRERADALTGAISVIEKMAFKGADLKAALTDV